jgi:hypothetical protein
MNAHYRVAVVGSGSAGKDAALLAARAGLRTAVIGTGSLGGTGLHRGCDAVRALRACATQYDTLTRSSSLGMNVGHDMIDPAPVTNASARGINARADQAALPWPAVQQQNPSPGALGHVPAYGQIARIRVIARGSLQAWLGFSGSYALLCARDALFCARDAFQPAFDGGSFLPSDSGMPPGRRFPSPDSAPGSGRQRKCWIEQSSQRPLKAQRVLSSLYLVCGSIRFGLFAESWPTTALRRAHRPTTARFGNRVQVLASP